MHRRPLGRTGIEVPAVGMGTWRTFDVRGGEAQAVRRAVVDAALASDANLFDTSPMYGEAERVLAAALEGRRDQAIVATKVWTPSREEGRAQIAAALDWYGTVDVYQVHNLVAWREWVRELERLRGEGKVRAIGVTHYSHGAFPDLLRAMKSGLVDVVQLPYNAADDRAAHDLLPAAADLGIGVLVMRPLGEGSLVRRKPAGFAEGSLARFGVRTWAQALLKWILSDPRVHCAIPATSRPERMRENAEAGEPPWLDDEAREYVRQLARG